MEDWSFSNVTLHLHTQRGFFWREKADDREKMSWAFSLHVGYSDLKADWGTCFGITRTLIKCSDTSGLSLNICGAGTEYACLNLCVDGF